jgi:hypothetical protein
MPRYSYKFLTALPTFHNLHARPFFSADESFLAVIFLLARAKAFNEALGTLDYAFQQPAPIVTALLGTRAEDATSLAAWFALLFFPVFLLKQIISGVHLVRAAQRLVEIDQLDA